ncbi:MAG: hypothetical protein AB3N16_04970 [Flavobacteriaceae bacterium]
MGKFTSLAFGILAVGIIVYGFVQGHKTASVLGFEINIWLYRAVWALIGISSFRDFYQKRKAP